MRPWYGLFRLTFLIVAGMLCVQVVMLASRALRMNHSIHQSLVLFDSGEPLDDPHTSVTASSSCA